MPSLVSLHGMTMPIAPIRDVPGLTNQYRFGIHFTGIDGIETIICY